MTRMTVGGQEICLATMISWHITFLVHYLLLITSCSQPCLFSGVRRASMAKTVRKLLIDALVIRVKMAEFAVTSDHGLSAPAQKTTMVWVVSMNSTHAKLEFANTRRSASISKKDINALVPLVIFAFRWRLIIAGRFR